MKVALIQPPVWWTIEAPLGLAQMAGCAKAAGHEVSIFDVNIRLWKDGDKAYESLWQWEQFHYWNQPDFVEKFFADREASVGRIVEEILKTDSELMAFSVNSGSYLATLELARLIKKGDPRRKVLLGGQYFFFGDAIEPALAEPAVDAVVQGAGDEVFPRLLDGMSRTGDLDLLPGVWMKRGGSLASGGPPVPVKDLDQVPFADFTGLPLDLYGDPVRLPFAASRGCVWQCRFCSARSFWKGYAYMSGDRIFAEIAHHKKLFPGRCHFEFHDITANGAPAELHRFAKLAGDFILADKKNFFGWKINAIIRPEMTAELLMDLRLANCHDIIYGVESGSPRVLKLMNKPYTHKTASRVLRDTKAAGINTTINIMFGFPGETEEDFQKTLDFIRDNRASLHRVYGSATLTSLEERSYLHAHQEEFGVRPLKPGKFHNLFWESEDGRNTYPVRLSRYKRFRELVLSLGLDAYKGINGSLEQNDLESLMQYHDFAGKPASALRHALDYLDLDLYHRPTRDRLRGALPALKSLASACRRLERSRREGAKKPVHLQGLLADETSVAVEDGRQALYWEEERVEPAELKALLRRVEMTLQLIDSECRRGDDKKPEPVCAR
jgi:hypothetical protein